MYIVKIMARKFQYRIEDSAVEKECLLTVHQALHRSFAAEFTRACSRKELASSVPHMFFPPAMPTIYLLPLSLVANDLPFPS
jgi:hypothetical protein